MTVGEAKRRGGKPRATDMGGLMFILPDAMSLEFRQRAASARREGGACFACGGPLTCLAELGVTVMRDDPDGGVTTAMACVPCERGPRAFLVEAWSRRESDSRLTPEVARWARALAEARAEADLAELKVAAEGLLLSELTGAEQAALERIAREPTHADWPIIGQILERLEGMERAPTDIRQ
jgi:hypothetical protein